MPVDRRHVLLPLIAAALFHAAAMAEDAAPLIVGQPPAPAMQPAPPQNAPTEPARDLRIDVILSYASYHYHRDGQNEFNPGLGLTVGLDRGNWTPYLGCIAYHDSHDETARGAVIGLRYAFTGWFGLDYCAGYMRNARYEGLALVPGIYVNYGRFALYATALGKSSIGFLARVTL